MRIQRGKYLFNYRDCFSMDMTLSPIIHAGLVKFKEELVKHPCVGHPSNFCNEDGDGSEEGFQEWLDVLDKMIYAFDVKNEPDISDYNFDFASVWKTLGNGLTELVSIDPTDEDEYDQYHKDCEEHQKKCEEGRELFSKYFNSLWL